MSLVDPTLFRNRVTDITVEDLRTLDTRLILLDIDNTLTEHAGQALTAEVSAWVERMRAEGFLLSLVSNSQSKRVKPFAGLVGLPYRCFACKPLTFAFRRVAREQGVPLSRCVVVGDQLYTDILGANLAGIRSIQLLPIELEQHKPFMRFKRGLEKRVMARRAAREQLQKKKEPSQK